MQAEPEGRYEKSGNGNSYVAAGMQAGRGEGVELKYNYIAKYVSTERGFPSLLPSFLPCICS